MADTARKITAESLHARLPVGEVARFDEQLVSRFHLLHEETGELATPPVLVAFDCMCLSPGAGCTRDTPARDGQPIA